MEPKFKIDIPKPCHEDWNAMTPNEKGKFCSVCNKGVVDFTEMRAVEIQTYFLKNQGQQICGRFKNEQMSATFDLLIPQNVFKQRMSFHKAFLLILFVVMGSTLFSCKNHDNATLGEVSIAQDTVESRTTVGIIIQPKDSIPEKTAEEFTADGYFKTGDIGVVDARGFFKIVDRKKDMILVSGFNVYPNEVEEVASACPGVLECAAIGVPDEKTGETVKLVVVKKDPALTEAQIIAYCRENMTAYKQPRVIEFRDELPKTPVGKILRRELRSKV